MFLLQTMKYFILNFLTSKVAYEYTDKMGSPDYMFRVSYDFV